MIKFADGNILLEKSGIILNNWTMTLEVNGQQLDVSTAKVTKSMEHELSFICRFVEPDIEWKLRVSEEKETVTVETVIANSGKSPLTLGKAYLLNSDVSGLSVTGDDLVALPWVVNQMQRVYKIHDPEMPERAKVLVQFNK